MELCNLFFKEEHGNRVTSNNMEGFTMKVIGLFKQNETEGGEKNDKK